MGRFLLYAIPAIVTLYALIDAIQTSRSDVRSLPKWVWLVVIILVPFLGAVAWLIAGRQLRQVAAANPAGAGRLTALGGRRRADVAPDDDPKFLRKLADDEWSRKMRARREVEGDATDTDTDTSGQGGLGRDADADRPDDGSDVPSN